jgi:hypothetical protein
MGEGSLVSRVDISQQSDEINRPLHRNNPVQRNTKPVQHATRNPLNLQLRGVFGVAGGIADATLTKCCIVLHRVAAPETPAFLRLW